MLDHSMGNIYRDAHKYCDHNKAILKESKICGCFYCQSLFNYDKITDWIGDTALCPYCDIDSVIPKNEKYAFPVDILQGMHDIWF